MVFYFGFFFVRVNFVLWAFFKDGEKTVFIGKYFKNLTYKNRDRYFCYETVYIFDFIDDELLIDVEKWYYRMLSLDYEQTRNTECFTTHGTKIMWILFIV